MTTERAVHGRVIATIRKATGQVDRRLSFTEAREWKYGYEHELAVGYDPETAAQRSYDCLFASRRAK